MARGALLALGLAALLWRLLYLWVGASHGLFHGLFLDARFFAETAAAIRGGHGAGEHPYLLSPLYPYFLALFPSIEGEPATQAALGVRAVQAGLGAATCVLAARIAARAGGRGAGWMAGLATAFFGPLVHYETSVLVAGPQALFLTLAVDLASGDPGAAAPERPEAEAAETIGAGASRSRAARWAGVGLALGASAALRPTGLFVAAAFALALCAGALRGRRSSAILMLALVAGCALCVLPFTARNLAVSGEPVLLSANGGFNFWIGNHAGAQGVFQTPPGLDFERDPLGLALAEAGLGRPVGYREASAWWRARALADIGADPLRWLGLLGFKLALFLHPVEIPQLGASFAWHRARAWPLWAGWPLDARWILILALAAPCAASLAGGAAAARRLRWPLVAFWTYLAAICLFFVTARYRVPIVPLAAALAAVTVRSLLVLARGTWERPGATLALSGGIAAAAFASLALYRAGGPLDIPASTGTEERQLGISLVEQGRYEEAIEVYRRALAEREDPRTRGNLARALRAAGRIEEAIAEYQRVLAARPGDATALYSFGNLWWKDLANPREAERLFRKAIERDSRFAEAHFNLGAVLLERGELEEASRSIAEALELAGPDAPWRKDAEAAFARARLAVGRQNLEPRSPRPDDDE